MCVCVCVCVCVCGEGTRAMLGRWMGNWDGTITMQELRVAEVYFRSPFLWDLMLHHWAMDAQHFETG